MSWTIQKLLNWTTQYFTEKGLESPRLCAEMLLASALDLKRIDLYTRFDNLVEQDRLNRLHKLVKRAAGGEPIAYLVGGVEFYSLPIRVNSSCIIPRPETELLVDRAIDFLRGREGTQFACDLCTGSGCIAAAIAKNVPACEMIATDICDKALAIAAANIEKTGLSSRVKLLCGDLFDPVIAQLDTARFDLVVSNPPYVTAAEYESLAETVRAYEPRAGLLAGDDGLEVVRRIIKDATKFLKDGAALMLEIGHRHASAVTAMLEAASCYGKIEVVKDFRGVDRVVIALKGK